MNNDNVILIRRCKACYQTNSKLYLCGKCKSVYYCSKACQILDYPFHKLYCNNPMYNKNTPGDNDRVQIIILWLKRYFKNTLQIFYNPMCLDYNTITIFTIKDPDKIDYICVSRSEYIDHDIPPDINTVFELLDTEETIYLYLNMSNFQV